MRFLYFFPFVWVIFVLLDPNPDPATQINADPLDPDPKPCKVRTKTTDRDNVVLTSVLAH